ncbi:leucine-rich repeat-containing protein 45 isoform X1 [Pantherophis guttatus]|uniref:Leucine-rich repeat-containing protein 45 isoform X1 n=2 Tax=Pantherophis guttatus TaxID=94885 RepID=A0A6P9BLF4_PANGU|nr:leucine-rich repeat-containing protein 45 isoform X1 [Pantherophis guttatus]XP_034268803.1 leucine-rich repeat-containing protein 45 isoform X1 [Pantherophis guttatus]XP_034268804.1 leucine-rich repeat-containing protein 45 isoform X1 [Pantherophis guttatus]XP_034268805.1 leucine-rich repeat-containing protein 45 isoform X1 [Pantherophis guttatus]XP_060544722.1 leucine-rich repeat-containing protein 45 isoform X1 [Pantherophis guttatus]
MPATEMDAFRQSYTRLCKESGAEPQESILPHLEEATGRNRLDLATQSLSVDSCGVLGKLLQDDLQFTELILNDCMLSEEGAKLLLHGLCSNTVVKFLNLKGNNMRTVGTEALGKLLRQNKTIQRLTLEWNNLGVWEESFTIFCEGLGANHHLQMLDLRNNQINHQGAGELAMALKANSSLQELDLRWNNIGLLGGRALLNCLHSNRTVRQLELAGNNVPSDILKAVDQAIEHNQERQNILSKNRNMTKILSKEVMCLKEEKAKQFLDLMDTIDKQREEINQSNRVSAARVGRLQEALNERYSVMNSLKAKLQMTEAALALSEQKVCSLGGLLSSAKEEQTKLVENHAKEFQQHKKNSSDREAKLLQELSTANENNIQLKNEVDELERRCKIQQEQLFQVKEELTHTTAEMKLRAVRAEERLENEKKRFKQILSDAESLRMKEVGQITQHMETSEHALQERIQRLEAIRIGLEEELSQVKAAAFIERGKIEEEVIRAKNQTRLEEQHRLEQMEEKLRLMMQSRDEAQNHCLQQKQTVAEAQSKEGQLSLQVEGLKRRLEDLQRELGSKEHEKVSEVNKVRVELQEQIGHLEAERTAQEGLRGKIAALERQLKVLSSNHREALLDKDSEISSLLEKLRVREAEISRIREEEVQRASFLQNAILTYVQGSPLGSLSSKK